ncbi:MAG: DNA polymerase III subunit gamma/tau, partial [Desulfobulbaceae bacterium]|nr:DNA polymerase III subunit gamma/tau [Desulfobulbaceae bacterium]
PTPSPCNQCRSCTEIMSGSSVDLHEVDGASNRGIQEIRELKEKIRFMPTSSRFKIIIIDEVHMLTPEAFNALLKTLEEPPAHVYFMFATTEMHRVPVTILSRCQRYELKRVAHRELADHFSRLAESEGVAVEQRALNLIVREAGGSVRDGLSLLDQVFSYCGNEVKAIDVIDVLGLVSHQVIADLGSALLAGDLAGALDQLDRAYSYGMDLKRFINELLSWFRGLIVCKVSSQPKLLLDLAEEELASMQEAAAGYTVQTLSAFFNLLMESLEKVGYSSQPRLALEMAFIRAVQVGEVVPVSDILTRLDDVLAGVPLVDLAVVAPKPATMQQENLVSQPAPIKEKQTEPVIATQESDVVQPVNKAESDPSPESIEPPTPSLEKEKPVEPDKEKPEDGKQAARKKDVRKHWNEFLQYVRDRKPWMTAALQRSASASLEQGQLIVHFDDAADCMMLKSKDNITLLTEFALDFFQENLRVKFHVPDSNACEISPENGMDPQQERKALANDPLVLTALEIFNGQVGNIRVGPRFRKSLDSDDAGSKNEEPLAD